jgi:arabinan endo-1,5-alpha-L-arabinosidase
MKINHIFGQAAGTRSPIRLRISLAMTLLLGCGSLLHAQAVPSATEPVTATPVFSLAAGTYTSKQTVKITDTTSGAKIYYTTNGETPTTASTKYSGAITVSATETIEAIAVASGHSTSAIAKATYTITLPAATPVFSLAAGTYTSKQTVKITDTTSGAKIYYTTNGETPTTASTKYSGAITVSATETIEAIAVASGYTTSATAKAVYTITPTVATPVFSLAAGTYTSAQSVKITDATANSTIYYTINRSTPTTSSTKYTGAITVSSTETIEAIAVASGYASSSIAQATYAINTSTHDMGTLHSVSDSYQFKFMNAVSGLVLGISGQSQTAGASVVQESDTGSTDALWHFMPMTSGQFNVENLLTHQVLGISDASTAVGAQALQWADNGTADHLWKVFLLSDGNYILQNVNSGYFLEDANSNTTTSATIDQGARTATGNVGCACQEWTLISTGVSAYPAPRTVTGTGIYVHDPYMLQDPATHDYWLYGTHQTLAYSTDLSTFTYTTSTSQLGACTTEEGGYWLYDDSRCPIIGPDFVQWTGLQVPKSDNSGENTDIWAPSLMYQKNTYYQYYSIPVEPSTGAEAIIGLATSTTPYGPWTYQGWVISSWTDGTTDPITSSYGWDFVAGTTWNAIDPAPFVDASGNWWLIFGSWEDGTHLLPLSSSTGLRPTGSTTMYTIGYRPAGGEEGPFIYYWNGYYYYIAPINVCCNGTASTYRTIVGRSQTVTGPYYDRGGVNLADGGGTILVSSHDNIYGPGGGSVFTDTGADGSQSLPTFVYHYYDGNDNGTPKLGISRLAFTSDGWPYVE